MDAGWHPFPEDEGALRQANLDSYANAPAVQRQQVIDRALQGTRAREREQYAAERARVYAWNEASLLQRMAMSPVSAEQVAAARAQWGTNVLPSWYATLADPPGRNPVRSHPR